MNKRLSFLALTLIIYITAVQATFGQNCADYPNWEDYPSNTVWYNSDQVNYQGKIYSPCYSSTIAPLSDPNNRTETTSSCTTFWGFITNCSSTFSLPQSHDFDGGLESWVSDGDLVQLLPANQLENQGWFPNGNSFINYNNNSCNNLTGNVIALRGSSNSDRILTSPSYAMAGYDSVIFDYDYFVSSMDNSNEGWNLDYSNDNGSSWVTVKTYRRDSQFDNLDCGPNDYGNKEVVILDNATYGFTNQSIFRMYTERDGGNVGAWDYLIIDNITITGNTTSTCSASGTIGMEKYDGISGTSISSLTGSANYPDNPSSSSQLNSFEIPTNVDDNYGTRVSGYICPPQTGYYTFWLASDDNGQLNLSTDDDPANKTTIATVGAWTNSRQWDKYASQKSNPVLLFAGNSYYVEALMKEQSGGDNLAVGWAKPGETTNAPSQVIPGSVLSPTVTAAPVDLFFEDFSTESNNTTTGVDLYGTNWYSDDNSGNPGFFGVYDDSDFIDAVFWAEDTDGLVYWYTDNIDIQGYNNLNLRSFVEFYKIDNDGDYIKFYYKLNNGSLQEIATLTGDNTDTYYDWDLTGVTGDNLQIWVEFNSDDNDDYHGIGNVKLTGILDCSSISNDITDATAAAGDAQATLSWSNPNANCTSIDEVMVVAKANSAVTNSPSGNGSAYTANAAFGSGTAFDGGSVVYKGSAETVTITGLTNGTTYYLTTFTREDSTWSAGVTVTVNPIESPYLFFEDFEDESDEAITGSDVNGIGWTATLNGHDANYFGVDTQNSNKLFRVDDLEDNKQGIKWESSTINIAGKTDLELSAYLEFDDTDSNDYLRVKILVDGFSTTTVASFDDDVNNQDGNKSWLLVDNSGNPITGNTLKIIIEFFHDSSEEYLVDNIRLTDGNYWLGNENDAITNTEKWSLKEVPTATDNAKIATGAHLKISNTDFAVKNFTVNGELTIDKDASLTTTADFKNIGAVNLNSDDNEFSSLLVEGTSTGSISYNRWVNNYEANTNGNDVISSPVTGESWSSIMSNNSATIYNNGTYWSFTPYNNGYATWGDFYTSSTSVNIESGKGYRVATPAGNSQTVKFTGELVNGAVTVQLSRIQTRWNVVGNPYSTYIDLATFLQVNGSQLDEGYVLVLGYNGVNNTDGWAYYNLATALANNITIAPGQGFYLAAKNNTSTVVFNPSMKTVSGSDDFLQNGARSSTVDMQKLRLNVNNGSKTRHAELYFFNRDDVSNNFDLGYDALIKNDGDNFNLYSTPLDGTVNKLAIQTSHLDNMETSITPFGVEAQAGQQLTFSIDNLNITDNIIIWLEDRATGVWTELNSTSTYVINTTETISGIGRFYMHFENQDTLNIQEVNSNQIEIKAISGAHIITVSGNLDSDSVLELYDVAGRKLLTQNLDSYKAMHRIDVGHLPVAAYIVHVHNETQKTSKQVIIN